MIQVRFAGLGGQGILLMGEVLGEAAVLEKKYVGQSSAYGAEARGSACQSDVVISDSWIEYPRVTRADVLVCMSQGGYEQNSGRVHRRKGLIVLDGQLVRPDPSSPLRHISVPATERASRELKNRMAANMILLGTAVNVAGLVGGEALLKALSQRLPPALLEINRKALTIGLALGEAGKE
ncbi:MAG: 2-oxoacid:acceptor oxidoreductase family protein [Deltaproteobacteria bacterium]|nr:2-oxoacid:acceptor oxidoreductase family protein [Deltaproteobacteria bacterium]